MTNLYGERTAEEILEEMKDGARDDVDKREGSVVHDMLAEPANQFEMLGWELDAIYANGFADTADLEYLKRRASELGVKWKPALFADGEVTITGAEGTEIPLGYRVYTEGDVYFVTTEDAVLIDGTATVLAQALVGGISGNVAVGEVTQFDDIIAGITSVTNEVVFAGGIDDETGAELLTRYLLKVQRPNTSGNVYHYELWATEVEGIASAKVFPIWNGAGTVKVVVIGSNGRAPTPETIGKVTGHIEAMRPIGADVTVIAVTEIPLNVSATLTLSGDLTPDDVRSAIEASISDYLFEAAESGIVRYNFVGDALLHVEGVVDYADLTVNGGTSNIDTDEDAVAVIGEVTLNGA